MKIYHPPHLTAWSRRTSGLPLTFYDRHGKVTRYAKTIKRACYFEVPDATAFAVWFYRTNSGNPSVRIFKVDQGEFIEVEIEGLGDMAREIDDWLTPTV